MPQAAPQRLVRITIQLLVLIAVRLALALAGLRAAAVVAEPAPAAVAFALGTLGAAIALGADPRLYLERSGGRVFAGPEG